MLKQGLSDIFVVVCTSFLLLFLGLVILYGFDSSGRIDDSRFFFKQVVFSVVSVIVAILILRISYRVLKKASTILYFLGIGFLITVLFFEDIRGTSGWIDVGFFRIQPVESMKVILILFLASFFVMKRAAFGEFGRIVVSCVLVFIVVGLVLLQPDLGSAIVLLFIWAGMLFVSDMKAKYIFFLLTIEFLGAGGSWFFLEDYQKDRIYTTIRPQEDALGSGYNVMQSLIAVGSGGLFGKGVGGGSQSQLAFLPESHTDFIFASIVESFGIFGALFVLVLYGVLLHRIAYIAMTAGDSFGFLIASGVFCMFFVQIVINVGMNIGLVPVTGIPLPLLSYGGSSLLATALALGLVINIAYHKRFIVDAKDTKILDDNQWL